MSVQVFTGTEGSSVAEESLLAGSLAVHPAYQMGIERTRALIKEKAVGLFDGPPGTGKTTTALAAAGTLNYPTLHLTMPKDPSPLTMLRLLAEESIGPETCEWNGDKLKRAVIRELKESSPFIIIDEASYLREAGLSHLQYLVDATRRGFPLLLVGTGLDARLYRELPTLASRTRYRTVFEELHGQDLLNFLDALDPRLGRAEPTAIALIDGSFAQGRLRPWGHVLAVMNANGVRKPLDANKARALLGVISGRAAA